MPQTKGRSEQLVVGFQCAANEYQWIIEAAEEDQWTTSAWIRKTLLDAARRAAAGKRAVPRRRGGLVGI